MPDFIKRNRWAVIAVAAIAAIILYFYSGGIEDAQLRCMAVIGISLVFCALAHDLTFHAGPEETGAGNNAGITEIKVDPVDGRLTRVRGR